MSLILEALRKCEARQRPGEVPTVHSPTPAPTARRRRLPRWLLWAAVLMAVGASAWWMGRLAVPGPDRGTVALRPAALAAPALGPRLVADSARFVRADGPPASAVAAREPAAGLGAPSGGEARDGPRRH